MDTPTDDRKDAKAEPWRTRKLVNGRWIASEPSGPTEPGFVVMATKVRPAEAEEFRRVCATFEVRPNRGLRALVRKATGYLEPDREAVDALRAMTRQVTGIATNVNQIARVANRDRRVDERALMAEWKALGGQLARVEASAQRILDVAARRTDGLALLTDALRDEPKDTKRRNRARKPKAVPEEGGGR